MTIAMPILAYKTGFSPDKLGAMGAGFEYALPRSTVSLSASVNARDHQKQAEHQPEPTASRLKQTRQEPSRAEYWWKLIRENAIVSVLSAAAVGYSVVHPKVAFKVLTALPRAVINLPKTWTSFMNSRPQVFLPYKPVLLDTKLKLFRPLNIIKLGNMTLPDWTSRLMTLGLYIPQGYFSIKYQRQPYETWGRNVLVWVSTFYLIMLSRKPDFPINQFFNQLFLPKQKMSGLKNKSLSSKVSLLFSPRQLLNELVNPLRPDFNYLECFKKAGINLQKLGVKGDLNKEVQKAYWATLDLNELRQVKGYVEHLKMRYHATSELAILKQKLKVERFLKNMLILNVLKYTALALVMAYIVGVIVPYLVFKYISPLDRKFARPKMRYMVDPAEIAKLKAMNTMPAHMPIKAERAEG